MKFVGTGCATERFLTGEDEQAPRRKLALTPDGETARRGVMLSLINPVVRRSVAVFLGDEDYEMVEHMESCVIASLALECLPCERRSKSAAGGRAE